MRVDVGRQAWGAVKAPARQDATQDLSRRSIADGRRAPKKHPQVQTADFDALAAHLAQRGWGPQDLQLFSDARALSRATPLRVCKMVRDWFTAQLDVKDEAIQVRLLVETLKPVVSG